MPESRLIKRAEFRSFMELNPSGSKLTYYLIGEGFTNLAESKNAQEYSRQYIHEYTERTDVVGYSPSLAYSADAHTENPVIAKIMEVTDKELTGTDAVVPIVAVNTFDEVETGKCKAYKRNYAIIPDSKADGTDALIYTGTMRAVGDIVEGAYDLAEGTFTATGT